jgi:hypothetical protein
MEEIEFGVLAGLTLEEINNSGDKITLKASGRTFLMWHEQDCCEDVSVESIKGNVERAISEKIIDATENSNSTEPKMGDWDESWTWTYYTIRTQSETIVIRWYGRSNGYYSERVRFREL